MTSAVPTIPQATLELHELLQSLDYPDTPAPSIHLAEPTGGGIPNVVVMIAGGSSNEEFDSIGDFRRLEEYTLQVFLRCAVDGDTAEEAMERAWAIQTVIAQALREAAQNRTPGSTIQWLTVTSTEFDWLLFPDGYGYQIDSDVSFRATT